MLIIIYINNSNSIELELAMFFEFLSRRYSPAVIVPISALPATIINLKTNPAKRITARLALGVFVAIALSFYNNWAYGAHPHFRCPYLYTIITFWSIIQSKDPIPRWVGYKIVDKLAGLAFTNIIWIAFPGLKANVAEIWWFAPWTFDSNSLVVILADE